MRKSEITRKTRETSITASVDLDGGEVKISTGIGFFDHMLSSFALHSGIGLTLTAQGDLCVDCHHTVEDTGIVLGKAFAEALGDKSGIARFGSAVIPMDEALAKAAIDISGRPFLVFNASFINELIGEYDTCMTEEFFRALAFNAGITLHLEGSYGLNDHHKTEALFKAFAYAFRAAVTPIGNGKIMSSKGAL